MTKAKKTNLTSVIIVKCRAAGEFDSTSGCDYMLLDADELSTKARRAARIVKTLVKEHPDLAGLRMEIMYFGNPVVISDATIGLMRLSKDNLGKLEESGYVIVALPEERIMLASENAERVECTTGHVDEHTIYWTTYPKHSPVTVESDPVATAVL